MELEWKTLEYQKQTYWRKDKTERRNIGLAF